MDDADRITEVEGKAAATLAVQLAMIGFLVNGGALTKEQAATIGGMANELLDKMDDLSADALVIAQAVLKGQKVFSAPDATPH